MVTWIAAAPASSTLCFIRDGGYCCRAAAIIPSHLNDQNNKKKKKKVVVVGSGWAGLGSAHHLSKQGFDVTVLEPAGSCPAEEVGVRGCFVCNDEPTSLLSKFGYTRVAVEIDTAKSLVPETDIELEGLDMPPIWQHFEYEHFHLYCPRCGRVGHCQLASVGRPLHFLMEHENMEGLHMMGFSDHWLIYRIQILWD